MNSARKTTIFLARHGETYWNIERRLQGQLDSELTEQGIKQSYALADKLSNNNIDVIVSSHLKRANVTASICSEALKLEVNCLNALAERNFGEWQGQLFDGLHEHDSFSDIFHQINSICPPSGESALAAQQRFSEGLCDFLNRLSVENSNVLVVSHGEVMRCFLGLFCQDMNIDAYQKFSNGCCLSVTYCHLTQNFSLS